MRLVQISKWCYVNPDHVSHVTYQTTSNDFIEKGTWIHFSRSINELQEANVVDFARVKSDYGFEETIKRLKGE